jgi:glycine/D-amino acid oxidase-like deaminating enzyme
VRIVEQTAVRELRPHVAVTARGTVHATTVVRATEAYTPMLPGERRALLPLYSLMIATAPLPDSAWAEIGWSQGETLNDGRHLIIYAQRTADGRVAFGGRGAPYHFGSRVSDDFDRDPDVFRALEQALHDLIPQTRGVPITHRWGGPIGVARDWYPSVSIDRDRGLAAAGGYVGDGVAASNVAGRTLADLILSRDTELTRLPWVQHRSPRWEPEPLRWLAVNLSVRAMRGADEVERRTGRRSLRARSVTHLQGR